MMSNQSIKTSATWEGKHTKLHRGCDENFKSFVYLQVQNNLLAAKLFQKYKRSLFVSELLLR
jgi:hypothetical protein